MNRPSEWLRKERSPWTWPLVALIALLIIVVVGTVLALMFAGCAASPTRGGSVPDNGNINRTDSTVGLQERNITLSDGRQVTCILWSEYDLMTENTVGGLSCDFPEATSE